MLARPVGSEPSVHVSPRSDERKRRVPATSAQTTVPDGALSCAIDGNVIGDGDGVADGVADVVGGLGVGVGDVVGGVGDVAAGWFEHAARTRTKTRSARIGFQSLMIRR